jgi:hypothetical protein
LFFVSNSNVSRLPLQKKPVGQLHNIPGFRPLHRLLQRPRLLDPSIASRTASRSNREAWTPSADISRSAASALLASSRRQNPATAAASGRRGESWRQSQRRTDAASRARRRERRLSSIGAASGSGEGGRAGWWRSAVRSAKAGERVGREARWAAREGRGRRSREPGRRSAAERRRPAAGTWSAERRRGRSAETAWSSDGEIGSGGGLEGGAVVHIPQTAHEGGAAGGGERRREADQWARQNHLLRFCPFGRLDRLGKPAGSLLAC